MSEYKKDNGKRSEHANGNGIPVAEKEIDVSSEAATFPDMACCGLFIEGGGDVVYKMVGMSDFETKTVPDNYQWNGRFASIDTTDNGTTATGIFAQFD